MLENHQWDVHTDLGINTPSFMMHCFLNYMRTFASASLLKNYSRQVPILGYCAPNGF